MSKEQLEKIFEGQGSDANVPLLEMACLLHVITSMVVNHIDKQNPPPSQFVSIFLPEN